MSPNITEGGGLKSDLFSSILCTFLDSLLAAYTVIKLASCVFIFSVITKDNFFLQKTKGGAAIKEKKKAKYSIGSRLAFSMNKNFYLKGKCKIAITQEFDRLHFKDLGGNSQSF